MPHLIVTSGDHRHGDFIVEHWLRSLRDNVTLDEVEVMVLDYGLTDPQRARLAADGVACRPCPRDANVRNARWRDIASLLDTSTYDQVLAVDGGDVIFQADIRPLFEQDRDAYRAVCEDVRAGAQARIMQPDDFEPETFARIVEFVQDRPLINGGFILAPVAAMRALAREILQSTIRLRRFGTNQQLLNYRLYRDGFVRLPRRYNYVLVTSKSRFHIRNGSFYDDAGDIINVVHNAGIDTARAIRDFGYGPACNRRKDHVTLALMAVSRFVPRDIKHGLVRSFARQRCS